MLQHMEEESGEGLLLLLRLLLRVGAHGGEGQGAEGGSTP